jgi:prophage tail gpP-like protein
VFLHDVRAVITASDGTSTEFSKLWRSYEITHSLLDTPMSYRLTGGYIEPAEVERYFGPRLRDYVLGRAWCDVYVDGVQVAGGPLKRAQLGTSKTEGSFVILAGVGPSDKLRRARIPLRYSPAGKTLAQILDDLVRPLGVVVTGDYNEALTNGSMVLVARGVTVGEVEEQDAANTLAPGTVRVWSAGDVQTNYGWQTRGAVRAQHGQSVLEWLLQLLNKHRLALWDTPDGRIYIGKPSYTAEPIGLIERTRTGGAPCEGSIVEGSAEWNNDPPDGTTVLGRSSAKGKARLSATAWNTAYPEASRSSWNCAIAAKSYHELEAVQNHADLLAANARREVFKYTATLAGHQIDQWLIGPGHLVWAHDPQSGIVGSPEEPLGMRLFVTSRSFGFDSVAGTSTTIECIAPGTWIPGVEE